MASAVDSQPPLLIAGVACASKCSDIVATAEDSQPTAEDSQHAVAVASQSTALVSVDTPTGNFAQLQVCTLCGEANAGSEKYRCDLCNPLRSRIMRLLRKDGDKKNEEIFWSMSAEAKEAFFRENRN